MRIETKQELRHKILQLRGNLSYGAWQTASLAAQKQLISLKQLADAGCVALYMPIRNEVDTKLVLDTCLQKGQRVLLPRVAGKDLLFCNVESLEQLTRGCYDIPEPCTTCQTVPLSTADLVVVPGVAFDLHGHRIGFGQGFYDRCLAGLDKNITLIGLCHDFQIVEQFQAEQHDISMDLLVSEQQIIDLKFDR